LGWLPQAPRASTMPAAINSFTAVDGVEGCEVAAWLDWEAFKGMAAISWLEWELKSHGGAWRAAAIMQRAIRRPCRRAQRSVAVRGDGVKRSLAARLRRAGLRS